MAVENTDWPNLMFGCRWVVMGTLDDESCPYLSKVAVVPVCIDSMGGFVMHLSQLAVHTKYLQARHQVSLLFSEPDRSDELDPQTLARFSVSGCVEKVLPDNEEFQELAQIYIGRFPEAEMRFGFTDFHLFRFLPTKGHYVGGFGKAGAVTAEQISNAIYERLSLD